MRYFISRTGFPGLLTGLFVLIFALNKASVYAGGYPPPVKDPFTTLWAEVDSLENLGLTESANGTVKRIMDLATLQKNDVQRIKAFMHLCKYRDVLEEESFLSNMNHLNDLIDKSNGPIKSLLYSVKGEVIWSKYQSEMYKVNQRTPILDNNETDMDKWDAKKFALEAIRFYELSITDEAGLKKVPLENYRTILAGDSTYRSLRPSLYDFLISRAISFLSNPYLNVLEPAEKFEVDDVKYFAPGNEFSKLNFSSKDTLSSLVKALKLHQKWWASHAADADPGIKIQIELDRIKLIYTKSVLDNKATVYIDALKKLIPLYPSMEYTADIYFALASAYADEAGYYTSGSDETYLKEYRKQSIIYCDEAIAKYPTSEGAYNCSVLKKSLLVPSLSVNNQKAVTPKHHVLLKLGYRNTSKIYVKVYKHDFDKVIDQLVAYDQYLQAYQTAKSGVLVKEYSFDLKESEDHFDHLTEVAIDPLELGFYTITFCSSADDNTPDSYKGFSTIWSTNLSLYALTSYDQPVNYFRVCDRNTGEMVKGVKIDLYGLKYNYNTYVYDKVKVGSAKVDKQGTFNTSLSSENYFIDLRKGKDRFVSDQFYVYNYDDAQENVKDDIRIFLDRGLYRPGQTIQFKILATHLTNGDYIPKLKARVNLKLQDINYREISTLEVTTNEFGTASGSFTIPTSCATGSWMITTDGGSVYFSVEEYKRPKFEVTIDSIPGTYEINDNIEVRGKASALAGFGIDNAKVTYKVDRYTSMGIYDYYYYRRFSGSKTIATGELTTDNKGEFSFNFKAIADPYVKEKYDPQFNYNVTVDVTDQNGETRSTSFYVLVGLKSMNVGIGIPAYLDRSDTSSCRFYAYNLSGFEVNAKGSYEIHSLVAPADYLTTRVWEAPDVLSMNESDFRKKFPHQPWKDENDSEKWELGSSVTTGTFDTEKKTMLNASTWSKLEQGWYAIVIKSKDNKGKEVSGTYRFYVYEPAKKTDNSHHLLNIIPIKNQVKNGETAQFLVGTSADNVKLHVWQENEGKITKSEIITLNKEQKLYNIPIINASNNSTLYVHFAVIKYNEVFSYTQYLYIYDDSREMDIELVTFRDKLEPNQNEEWKIKVKGSKGENMAQSEVLVNMYDASLDQLGYANYWSTYFYPPYSAGHYFNTAMFNSINSGYGNTSNVEYDYDYYKLKSYEQLNYFGWATGYSYYYWGYEELDGLYDYNQQTLSRDGDNYRMADDIVLEGKVTDNKNTTGSTSYAWSPAVTEKTVNGALGGGEFSGLPPADVNKPRTNFNETAFFYPHLITNEQGEVSFSFKVPESLTQWKFRALAITKDLRTAYIEKEAVTQKQIMITSFAPRFVREGDKLYFSAKVTNLTASDINANVKLELTDALTGKPVILTNASQISLNASVKAGESQKVKWYLEIPEGLQALTYTLTANTGTHTDGEQMTIPVLSNRILITESVPLYVRGDSTKTFTLKNLVNSGSSSTLKHEKLTLEVTSNPAWYALQALPYMMEYPYECAEQTFNRYYANAVGTFIANSDPRISKTMEIWKNYQPDAIMSNLEKNQDLKNILIEETPWLKDAVNETERKRRLAVLLDLNRMANESSVTLEKLKNMQLPSGAFPWFTGGIDNRYITTYIVSGMGHLRKLGINQDETALSNMLIQAVNYLDNQITRDYNSLIKNKVNMELDNLGYDHIQYLYARSFFKDIAVDEKNQTAYNYYYGQSEKYWLNKGIYMQGMIALAHSRSDHNDFAQKVMKSVKENSIRSDEMGMYWKQMSSWYWYDAPIEMQALMIEAFDEVTNDQTSVEELKIWLLKNKQTNDWKTTKATADACYALLLKGTDLLAQDPEITIQLGSTTISSNDVKKEAGTGYFKQTIDKSSIKPDMGNIKIAKKGQGISWGAVYWQYFEHVEKVPSSINQLQVNKKIFRKIYTSTGDALEQVTEQSPLKIGDRLVVRLELKVDRAMEFVHIKDMRASSLEPENVISSYKYREGLSYYESTRDAATNFFVEYMPKGTYIFEYNLRVTHAGEFSNGLTTIQCMYAPEFTSHTAGMHIKTVE